MGQRGLCSELESSNAKMVAMDLSGALLRYSHPPDPLKAISTGTAAVFQCAVHLRDALARNDFDAIKGNAFPGGENDRT